MLNFGDRQTSLDLNGPVLSIVQQPSSVAICNAGIATFVGIPTATFPTQSPSNPATNTGILTQRWHVDGYGALSDGSIVALGITVVGSATTTLTISGAISPTANGLGFFLRPDYIPSAYSQPVGSAVTVGTARSTGNGNNEPYDSSVATLTVYPTITITDQPDDASAAATKPATFNVSAVTSDSSTLSYQWLLNGSNLTDSSLISGSTTPSLTITSNTVGVNTVQAVVSHPTSCDSPKYSDVATFTVVEPRQIITFENITNSSSASITQWNIFDNPVVIGQNISRSLLSFYAPEKDLDIEMELHGSSGSSYGSYSGGRGGYAKIRFTMRQNEEYVFAGLAVNAVFLYRKASLIASVGRGGNAGPSGRGGNGGGLSMAGENGQGRGGGIGGAAYAPGTLPAGGGIFGSASRFRPTNGADSIASVPFGGRALPCPRGNQSISPCTNLGTTKFLWGQSTPISNTGTISRGFKQGYGIRNTDGLGSGGGNGGSGATGGAGGTSGGGGGGGGGYTDGSVTIIENVLGGSQYTTNAIIIRTVSTTIITENVTDTQGTISVGSPFTVTRYTAPGITGTEGHPVGSLKYIVTVSTYVNPSLSVNILNDALRASGLTASDNSISVSSGYPIQTSDNTFEVAFDMTNSQGPGRQATFVRSFSLTMTA